LESRFAVTVTLAGSQALAFEAFVDAGAGVEVEPDVDVWLPLGVGVGLPPGLDTMSTIMTMTARRPNSTTSRLRQYTRGDCGPTGLRNVDMSQG
jgi:hypothetical protein